MRSVPLFLLAALLALFFTACDGKNNPKTDKDTVTDNDSIMTDDDLLGDEEPDADGDVTPPVCKLEDSFFDAMPAEWTSFFTLKMSGLINDSAATTTDNAFLVKTSTTLLGETYNLGDDHGVYLRDSVTTTDGTTLPAIVAVGVGSVTWPVANKLVSLWAGQTFVVVDDLLNWKTAAEAEGATGTSITGTYQVAVFEVWLGIVGSTQTTRMECVRGLSAMNADETAFDGGMFVCVDNNTEWAVGEQMKMMDYSKMVDDPAEIVTLLNEGLETTDPNYRTDVCRCWAADGTTIMDCEDMKDEFGVGVLPDDDDVTDDGIVTDDGEAPDTIDTDIEPDVDEPVTDEMDTDIIEETEDDLAVDDDIIVTTPCTPNPCTAFEHSNGVCTVEGEGFSCGCETDYTWNTFGTVACINYQLVSCDTNNANPVNSHDVVTDVIVTYTTADGWTDPADCAWACDTDYTLDGGSVCIDSKQVSCDTNNGNPANSTDIIADVTVNYTTADGWELPADCAWECDTDYLREGDACINEMQVDCALDPAKPVNSHDIVEKVTIHYTTLNGWELSPTCAWECDTDYTLDGGSVCIDSKLVACDTDNANPSNSHDIVADVTVTYTTAGDWTAPADCAWECDATYHLKNGVCDPDTRNAACTNTLPANASWSASGNYLGDGTVNQTWDGTTYMPKRDVCPWACDAGFALEGGACINSKEVSCDTENANPENSSDIVIDVPVTYDGSVWSDPALCAWECDATFHQEGETCVFNTKWTDCPNTLPDHAVWSGDNASGQFMQTWNGNYWYPIEVTFVCTWTCEENYTVNLAGDACDFATRTVDCTNIPANATGTGTNADGKISQTWNGTAWLPADNTCTFACDTHYTLNGDVCDPDTQRVPCTNSLPTYAVWIAPNGDGKFEQTWNGTDDWTPATFECAWACDPHYPYDALADECVFQPIVYVDLNAGGEIHDGYSWATAFTDLSAAIGYAVPGQELWVAAGIYHPTTCTTNWQICETTPGNLRARNFTMKPGVGIYGGFNGTETVRNDRDWETNVTILSGDLEGDDEWDDVNKTWLHRTDNTYHIFANFPDDGLDDTSVLDGFTISGGQADLEPYNTSGGGVNLGTNDSPTIRNCSFIGNFAIASGGAISAFDTSLTVENCSFDRNIAVAGGAISLYDADGSLTVTDCTFDGNRTAAPDNNQRGGAIYVNAAVSVNNSDFIGNYTRQEGSAIATNPGATINIDNCLFHQNSYLTTSGDGYVVRVSDGGSLTVTGSAFTNNTGISLAIRESTGTVTDTRFENNTAINSGALEAPRSNLTVTGCKFIGNSATIAGSGFARLGGAIFISGMNDAGVPVPGLVYSITNSEFRNNTAGLWGGALLIIRANPVITNCTFDGNADSGSDAIKLAESNTIFNNTILWDEVEQIAGSVGPYTFAASNPVFTNSDVYQSGGSAMTCGDGDDPCWVLPFGTDGGNNIDTDPLFDATNVDNPLSLQATSPCIDAGDDELIPLGVTTDILGDARIQGDTVDMGAYEQ